MLIILRWKILRTLKEFMSWCMDTLRPQPSTEYISGTCLQRSETAQACEDLDYNQKNVFLVTWPVER
jgi:hypothetical protein